MSTSSPTSPSPVKIRRSVRFGGLSLKNLRCHCFLLLSPLHAVTRRSPRTRSLLRFPASTVPIRRSLPRFVQSLLSMQTSGSISVTRLCRFAVVSTTPRPLSSPASSLAAKVSRRHFFDLLTVDGMSRRRLSLCE